MTQNSSSTPTANTFQHTIGTWQPSAYRFLNITQKIETLFKKESATLSQLEKFEIITTTLIELIVEHKIPCFLLPAVLDYIYKINQRFRFTEAYSFTFFEQWLNQSPHIDRETNLLIRGKIVGRYIPREEYQVFFPIGMDKYHSGSHFIAAHLSPDVDTTVASFIGWLDAFGCRVSEKIHYWSLPKGFSDAYISTLFDTMFIPSFLSTVPRSNPVGVVTALDMVSKKNVCILSLSTSVDDLYTEHTAQKACIIVDETGRYKGELSQAEAKSIRYILQIFLECLAWWIHSIATSLHDACSQKKEQVSSFEKIMTSSFSLLFNESAPIFSLPEETKQYLCSYIDTVLSAPSNVDFSTIDYSDCLQATDAFFSTTIETTLLHFFSSIAQSCDGFAHSEQFLQNDVNIIQQQIEAMLLCIKEQIDHIQNLCKRVEHYLIVKEKVYKIINRYVETTTPVEEINHDINDISTLPYITVVAQNGFESYSPVGVIWQDELKKSSLATLSLRDFSNLEETKMASYIDVISVVDHHKSSIKTSGSSTLILGDTQSCNTLIADISFSLNQKWASPFFDLQSGEQQRQQQPSTDQGTNTHNTFLATVDTSRQQLHCYFVDQTRQTYEYILYILAILDDTDLLSKVSRKDILCLEKLINHAASLVRQQSVEVISLKNIFQDSTFVKKAAAHLLKNDELYSLYKNVYSYKEKNIALALTQSAQGSASPFFYDTKELNGCCRVGQTKLFENNIPLFHEMRLHLIERWIQESKKSQKTQSVPSSLCHHVSSIDFFLHMMSTIPGEREAYIGSEITWPHRDEIWIFSPQTERALEHLRSFFASFQTSLAGQTLPIEIIFEGPFSEKQKSTVETTFIKASSIKVAEHRTSLSEGVIVLRYPAGQINSRKAQIGPFLPRL